MTAMRSYWGTNTGGVQFKEASPLLLRYRSGAEARENFLVGAIAVVRNEATIIDDKGRIVFPMKMVICRLNGGSTIEEECRVTGTPVTVIDPGRDHDVFIFPRAKISSKNLVPVVQKTVCRPIGECTDSNPEKGCKGCCNYSKHRKKNN